MSLTVTILPKTDSLIRLGVNCPFCGFPFHPGDHVVFCPNDNTPHHAACWQQNGNHCTLLGCTGAGEVVIPSTPTRPRRLAPFIVVGSIVTLSIVVLLLFGLVMLGPNVGNIISMVASELAYTPTPTRTATVTPTPTSQLPTLAGTPVPLPVSAILPENVNRVVELARWGKAGIKDYYWSPRGTWLIAQTNSGLRFYNGNTLHLERMVETGPYPIISPDETLIVSVGRDNKTIQIQDIRTGQIIGTLATTQGPVAPVKFSGDGKLLLVADIQRTLNIWEVQTRKKLFTFPALGRFFPHVIFSPDATYLLVLNDEGFQAWNLRNGTEAHEIIDRFANDRIIAISDDTSIVVTVSGTKKIIARHFANSKVISQIEAFESSEQLPRVTLSPKGKWVATKEGIHRVTDGRIVLTKEQLRTAPFTPSQGSFDATERYWAFSAGTLDVIWDLTTLTAVPISWSGGSFKPFKLPAPVLFKPDGTRVATGAIKVGGQFAVWKTSDGQLVDVLDADTGNTVFLMSFTAGKLLTVSASRITLWNLTDGLVFKDKDNPVGRNIALSERAIILRTDTKKFEKLNLPDLSRSADSISIEIVKGCENSNLIIVTSDKSSSMGQVIARGNLLAIQQPCADKQVIALYSNGASQPTPYFFTSGNIQDFTFSLDQSLLIISAYDAIHVLRVPQMTLYRHLSLPNNHFGKISLTSDNKVLAAASGNGQVVLWNLVEGTVKTRLEIKGKYATQLIFSPNNQILALATTEDELQLWRVSDGMLLTSFYVPGVTSIAFSNDGTLLATGTEDGVIRLWGPR